MRVDESAKELSIDSGVMDACFSTHFVVVDRARVKNTCHTSLSGERD
jgi:hypothetical protein